MGLILPLGYKGRSKSRAACTMHRLRKVSGADLMSVVYGSPILVLALLDAVSSYLERVSLRYLPNKAPLHKIGSVDPAGFEPASATVTECYVSLTPRALNETGPSAVENTKVIDHRFYRRRAKLGRTEPCDAGR